MMGTLQEVEICRTAWKIVGIRQKAAFRVFTGMPEPCHDFPVIHSFQCFFNHRLSESPLQDFPEGLALNDGKAVLDNLSIGHLLE